MTPKHKHNRRWRRRQNRNATVCGIPRLSGVLPLFAQLRQYTLAALLHAERSFGLPKELIGEVRP